MKLSKLRDDAFLYKDLTQWIRRQTFLPLFFGMLVAGEVITLMVFGSSSSRDGGGEVILSLLVGLLGIFGLVIAVQCFMDTYRERRERLFEIHMLSGILPNRLVRGKFLSLLVQFAFGLSCVVPYMFFAVMQGNVGYLELLSLLIGLVCGFSLLALWAILSGLVVGARETAIGRVVIFLVMLDVSRIPVSIGAFIVDLAHINSGMSLTTILILVPLFSAMVLRILFLMTAKAVPFRKKFGPMDAWKLLHEHESLTTDKKAVSTKEPESSTA